jgi:NitT/TauT family transport system substrate-binding protein
MMTLQGKVLIALVAVVIVGIGCWRWWDKIAPAPQASTPSINVKDINKKIADAGASVKKAVSQSDVLGKLLKGTNDATLVDSVTIPAISGISAYEKSTKNGKVLVRFPINVWPGWAPIIVANNGMAPNDNSIFYKKYGFYVELSIVDDPIKARDLFATGYTHILWGTLDMMALFAPALTKDSRTVPVICQQIDFSNGGDGLVARSGIKSINDLRMKDGVKRKVVVAQNSPSHYFIMTLLLDANIDPGEIDFRWTADAPSAAKLFVQDSSFDAFVGWSPDIYTVADMVPNTRIVVNSSSANHVVADVWAVRNDFYKDHYQIVQGLVDGIFQGMEMVRQNPTNAAAFLSEAYGIPKEDCMNMIGKDGGISTGDAHLTNYRENFNFFLNPMNVNNFEGIWNKASTIYQSLGAIDVVVNAGKVKESKILTSLAETWKGSTDLSQPNFNSTMIFKNLEADDSQLLTTPVSVNFKPGKWELDVSYDTNITTVIEKIAQIAGNFGNAYIVIEGNSDASMKGLVPNDAIKKLSADRAEAVKKAILLKYPTFDPNKFRVIGNGWDNPLANCTDPTNPEQRRKNRRTDIKVFPLEQQ